MSSCCRSLFSHRRISNLILSGLVILAPGLAYAGDEAPAPAEIPCNSSKTLEVTVTTTSTSTVNCAFEDCGKNKENHTDASKSSDAAAKGAMKASNSDTEKSGDFTGSKPTNKDRPEDAGNKTSWKTNAPAVVCAKSKAKQCSDSDSEACTQTWILVLKGEPKCTTSTVSNKDKVVATTICTQKADLTVKCALTSTCMLSSDEYRNVMAMGQDGGSSSLVGYYNPEETQDSIYNAILSAYAEFGHNEVYPNSQEIEYSYSYNNEPVVNSEQGAVNVNVNVESQNSDVAGAVNMDRSVDVQIGGSENPSFEGNSNAVQNLQDYGAQAGSLQGIQNIPTGGIQGSFGNFGGGRH